MSGECAESHDPRYWTTQWFLTTRCSQPGRPILPSLCNGFNTERGDRIGEGSFQVLPWIYISSPSSQFSCYQSYLLGTFASAKLSNGSVILEGRSKANQET
jgi:hypothetical protein